MNEGFTLRRHGAVVHVNGDVTALAWVAARGHQYFENTPGFSDADGAWRIIASRVRSTASMDRFERRIGDGRGTYFVDSNERLIIIDIPSGPWLSLATLRMVRDVMRWQLFHRGAIFLHGNVVARDGAGIAIFGPSRGGKTTSLLNCLRTPGTSMVAEDDLTLVQHPSAGWIALGWPGCVRLRRDMIPVYPELDGQEFEHPANGDSGSGLLRIFPEELHAVFGCEILPEIRLSEAAWLEWSEAPGITPLRGPEFERALIDSWDILPERRPGTRPSWPLPSTPDWHNYCFNPFLFDAFGLPNLVATRAALSRSFEQVNAYRLKHSNGMLPCFA